jgi:hypothetical protein
MTRIKSLLFFGLIISALATALVSCKKDDPIVVPPTVGKFRVAIEHVWGPSEVPFEFGVPYIHDVTGDTLSFSTLRYYFTNIKLKDDNGNWWAQSESYFIVDHSDPGSMLLELEDVPIGEYEAISFTFGVDSTRNVSGAQTGALSAANAMFWSWTTGYIMIKVEGLSPQSSFGNFSFHLGGFSGPDKAVHTREQDFAQSINITETSTQTAFIRANPSKLWDGGTPLSTTAVIHVPGQLAGEMSYNFASWMHLDRIED